MKTIEHKLEIKSLHDACASCSCGGWNVKTIGVTTMIAILGRR